jgi:hypothetical protein
MAACIEKCPQFFLRTSVNDTVIQINEIAVIFEILMNFDPKQLTALTEILRLGSFEAAADALGVTQSAISQRLKALEDTLAAY